MTLVQASIVNSGNTAILVADRLLTREIGEENKYEFEGVQPKIAVYGNVGVGFAGVSYYGETILSKTKNQRKIDNICSSISKCIKDFKKQEIEQQIDDYCGLTPTQFFEGKYNDNIPEKIKEMIYGVVAENEVEVECIVAGFDDAKNARIIVINENGNQYDMTNFGVTSIGSGCQFSQMFFDMNEYKTSIPEIDGLFFAYMAKKWGEAPSGVGKKTDILIIRKNGNYLLIEHEDILMKKIEDAFNKDRESIEANRKELLKKLIKNSDGKLK